MAYIHAPSGTYPYSFSSLRRDNPETSFPVEMDDEGLADWGVLPVAAVARPTCDPITETVVETAPAEINGQWTQQWSVVSASAGEVEARKQAIKTQITADVQLRLDTFAQTRGYDNIVSACSYASSQHPKYGPEGRYCIQAREDTWDTLFAIEADVLAGNRPMPASYSDIESELPALQWPI